MKVLKFGGSSLGTPDRIKAIGSIVLAAAIDDRLVIVVSAFQGVTDQLIDCARLAARRDTAYEGAYDELAERHRSAINDLLSGCLARAVRASADLQLNQLREALDGIYRLGQCDLPALDVTASVGERLSALIVAAYLSRFCSARFVDARNFVTTDDQFTRANVIFSETNRATRRYFSSFWDESNHTIPVVTGFIGCARDGRTTTIGRNGSDCTAAIVGGALGASAIEIWTDVDGVLSADPKAVSSAFVLPKITYEEAMELSCFGARVLCPGTIGPAARKSIPIRIKNSFNPKAPGTLICRPGTNGHNGFAFSKNLIAKGVSSIADLMLLTLRGQKVLGVEETTKRLFHALASRGVNVVLSSQASSEHTICLAINGNDAAEGVHAITQEFRFELQHGLLALDQRADQAIIAVIGDGMKGHPDAVGKVFGALDRHNIRVSAIANRASELNVSCVVDAAQQSRALSAIHQELFEADGLGQCQT